jgi:hypothetical protein
MKTETNKVLQGRINLVQEERFRLITDSGQAYLLVLAHDSSATQADLRIWMQNDIPVAVEYEGEANTDSGVVHHVQPI